MRELREWARKSPRSLCRYRLAWQPKSSASHDVIFLQYLYYEQESSFAWLRPWFRKQKCCTRVHLPCRKARVLARGRGACLLCKRSPPYRPLSAHATHPLSCKTPNPHSCRFVHRQDPERFAADCQAAVGTRGDPTPTQAFGFGYVDSALQKAWKRRAGKEHPMWPPGRPGSPSCMTRHPAMATNRPTIAIKLVGALPSHLPTLYKHSNRYCISNPLSPFQASSTPGQRKLT